MLEIRNIVTKMQSNFDRPVSILNIDKERISELEDRSTETFQTEMQREKVTFKKEQNIKGLWNDMKNYSICTIEMPEEEKGAEEISEVIRTENFPKLITDIKPHIQEGWDKYLRVLPTTCAKYTLFLFSPKFSSSLTPTRCPAIQFWCQFLKLV